MLPWVGGLKAPLLGVDEATIHANGGADKFPLPALSFTRKINVGILDSTDSSHRPQSSRMKAGHVSLAQVMKMLGRHQVPFIALLLSNLCRLGALLLGGGRCGLFVEGHRKRDHPVEKQVRTRRPMVAIVSSNVPTEQTSRRGRRCEVGGPGRDSPYKQ